MASPFREIIEFFDEIGLFEVVLPFLLVFTIVFAIFEKTKVLGTEEHDGKKYPKKNLNAITSFVMAFLVIASSELVEIITTVSSKVVVLLFLAILFLLLVGSFYREGEGVFLEGSWKTVFMVIMFVGIIGIFLDTLTTTDGRTWLTRVGDFFGGSNDELVGSVLLLGMTVLMIGYITKDNAPSTPAKK